jgi:fumarate reductase flavoprotein subunit
MWDDAGIMRTAAGLRRAQSTLDGLAREVAGAGIGSSTRAYNLTWTDRLNLDNLILASRAIVACALAREDSRGAHFREDFPETSDLATSAYTVSRLEGDRIATAMMQVQFTRVRPGDTILREAAQ